MTTKAYLNALSEEGTREELMEWVRKLDAEVDALRAIAQWRPIETAPKDADGILVYAPAYPNAPVGEACFHEGTGWWWVGTAPGDYYADPIQPPPTHWLPLPAPPEKES